MDSWRGRTEVFDEVYGVSYMLHVCNPDTVNLRRPEPSLSARGVSLSRVSGRWAALFSKDTQQKDTKAPDDHNDTIQELKSKLQRPY